MPNEFTSVDDFVSGNETATKDSKGQLLHGKYFYVSVPEYTGATTYDRDTQGNLLPSSKKTSFLRVGAPNVYWTQEPGANLAWLAYLVGPSGYGTPNPDGNGNVPDAIRDEKVLARFKNAKLPDGSDNPDYHPDLYNILFPANPEDEPPVFSPFIDDYRRRNTGNANPEGPNGHGFTPEERQAISARLEKDCGWRDHADGNRITTTAGDKIEVIQGNYKLIVLGRTNDIGQGMGWEASGSNVQDFAGATMPGASVTVTWIKEAYVDPSDVVALAKHVDDLKEQKTQVHEAIVKIDMKLPTASHKPTMAGRGQTGPSEYEKLLAEKTKLQAQLDLLVSITIPAAQKAYEDGVAFNEEYQGGAWLLQNSTERVYQYSRNAGNFKEENWGDLLETYVGSENPVRVGRNDDDGMQGHPKHHYKYGSTTELDEKVPLNSSRGLPRGNPHIIEKTWATKIDSYTGTSAWKIPAIHEETWANTMTSETHADSIDEETHVSGAINSKTFAGAMTEVVAAGAIASTTSAGVIVEDTQAGAHVEMHVGALHSSIEVGGVIDLFLGGKVDIDISGTYEVKLGPHEEFKTKKDRLAIKNANVALEDTLVALSGKRISNVELMAALSTTITALKVNVGI